MSATLVGLVPLVRFGDGDVAELWNLIGIDFGVAAVLFGLAWVAALWYLGLHRRRVRWRLLSEGQDITRATILALVVGDHRPVAGRGASGP